MKFRFTLLCGVGLFAGSLSLTAAPVAYISNTSSDDVWVVDLTCQSVVAVIPVGNDPRGIAASPNGSRVYVANRFGNTVSVIDTALNTVVQTIDLGASTNVTATEPYDVVVSPDGARLYVAMKNGGSEHGDGTVVFVDLPSGNIVKEVILDSAASPEGIAISPDGKRLYVGARTSRIYIVDVPTQSYFADAPGVATRELVVTPDGQFVFARNSAVRASDNPIHEVINLGLSPFLGERGIVISPDGTRLFSVDEGNNVAVHSVDRSGTNPVVALVTNITTSTESQAYGIDLTADGSLGLVSFRGSDSVRIFSTATLDWVGPAIPMQFGAQTGNEPKQLVIVDLAGSPCATADLVVTTLSAVTLNPQTGLYEQSIRLTNQGTNGAAAARILVTGLATNATVFNASGTTTNGTPFLQYNLPLAAGASVDFVVEFFRPSRGALTAPTYTAEASTATPPAPPSGTTLQVTDRSAALNNGRFLIEFSTTPGRRYAVQYSADTITWKTAQPIFTAAATRTQWYDDGPPKTESKPASVGARFYRVVELP